MPDSLTERPDSLTERVELLELTSHIVSAYAGNNSVASADLPQLIEDVFGALSQVSAPLAEPKVAQKPAVPVKKSVTNQAIVCLDCGQGQKMLKRHLSAAHGLTPEEYRAKWRLPYDYPIVAPDYAAKRRELAKRIGFGRKPKQSSAKASSPKNNSRRKATA
ncbi:MAG TPA: MucR family transcriptional regulator [Thermohalobaculum sp.]|nr:MucR family transcriptional regulator [Thermohalobaculum sp.]